MDKYREVFRADYIPHDLKAVLKLQQLIEANFRIQKHPEFYTKELGMSLYQLNKATKEYLGKTVHQLIKDRTYDEAVHLLQHTGLQSKEITYMLGFCDPSYFIKWFRQISGVHPSEFRVKSRHRGS